MAINLLGSSNARVDFGTGITALISGSGSLTIALTLKLTAAPGDFRLATQWGNGASEPSWLLSCNSSGQVNFLISNTVGQFYGKTATSLAMVNGGLYRIVAKVQPSSNSGAIWVNGVSETVAQFIASDNTTVGGSIRSLEIGHETDEAVDGQDGDYSEVAIWKSYLADEFCEAYGLGYSPRFYRATPLVFYAPLWNTAHLVEEASGFTGTNSSGTDADHPPMRYPSPGSIIFADGAVAAANAFPALTVAI